MILSTLDLPAPFGPDDADLRAGQERQRDVVEDHLVAVRLAHLVHGVDELSHVPSLLGSPNSSVAPAGEVIQPRTDDQCPSHRQPAVAAFANTRRQPRSRPGQPAADTSSGSRRRRNVER